MRNSKKSKIIFLFVATFCMVIVLFLGGKKFIDNKAKDEYLVKENSQLEESKDDNSQGTAKENLGIKEEKSQEKPVDYSGFSGKWINEEQEENYNEAGGTTLDISVEGDGNISGVISSIRGKGSHIAEVNLKGKIVNGELEMSFEDDNWGHSGQIKFNFSDGVIKASINRTEDSSNLWGIEKGEIKFIR